MATFHSKAICSLAKGTEDNVVEQMISVLWVEWMSASGHFRFPAAAYYGRGTTTMEGANSTA